MYTRACIADTLIQVFANMNTFTNIASKLSAICITLTWSDATNSISRLDNHSNANNEHKHNSDRDHFYQMNKAWVNKFCFNPKLY